MYLTFHYLYSRNNEIIKNWLCLVYMKHLTMSGIIWLIIFTFIFFGFSWRGGTFGVFSCFIELGMMATTERLVSFCFDWPRFGTTKDIWNSRTRRTPLRRTPLRGNRSHHRVIDSSSSSSVYWRIFKQFFCKLMLWWNTSIHFSRKTAALGFFTFVSYWFFYS